MPINFITFCDYKPANAVLTTGADNVMGGCDLQVTGTSGYAIVSNTGGDTTTFFRGDFTSGTSSYSAAATFTTPGISSLFIQPALIVVSSSLAYLVVPTGSLARFFRFNPSTVSGTVASATATLTAVNAARGCSFFVSGTTAYLVINGSSDWNASFHRFDPTTVTGTVAATSTMDTNGRTTRISKPQVSGTTFYCIVTANLLRFDASGTPTTGVVATFATNASPDAQGSDIYVSGSTGYAAIADNNNTRCYFYRFTPATASGTIAIAATFITASNPYDCKLIVVSTSLAYLLVTERGNQSLSLFRFNPSTVSGTIPLSSVTAVFDTGRNPSSDPIGSAVVVDGTNAYALTSCPATDNLKLFNAFDERPIQISLSTSQAIGESGAIRKVSGGTLTCYSDLSDFVGLVLLKAGAASVATGYNATNIVYGWNVTFSTDSVGTLNENFTFSGATADIVGNYLLNVPTGVTVTFGSKGTYASSLAFASGSTIVLTANTTFPSTITLSSGVTVNAIGGSWTLTIPYANPGLTLGAGVTLQTPIATYVRAVTGVPTGSSILLALRSASGFANINQFSLASGNNSGNSSLVVSTSIPADTPATGFVRIARNNGTEDRLAYTSWSGSAFTLSGTLPATYSAGNGCYVGYLDVINSASTTITVSLQYVANRNVVLTIRQGSGSGKFQDYQSNYTLTNADSVIPFSAIADPVNNR